MSPATQSLKFSIELGSKTPIVKIVNVTPTSSGCAASLGGTVCTIAFDLAVAKGYVASLTAYDGLSGAGNALSIGQSLTFDVAKGKVNSIPITLDAIPKSIVVKKFGSNAMLAEALDADGNFIAGPGAPVFSAAKTSGASIVAIAQPASTSPNKIGLTLVASPPAAPQTETIGVTASYPAGSVNGCAQPGAVCSSGAAVTAAYLSTSTFFTGDYTGSAVKGFSTPFTGVDQAPAYTLAVPSAYAVLLDSANNVFAMQYGPSGALYKFASPYTASPVTDASIAANSYSMAINSTGDVFASSGSNAVSMVAPPYNAAPTVITAGVSGPYGLAVDAQDNLYIANEGTSKLGVYASSDYTTEEYTVPLAGPAYSATRIGSNLYVGEKAAVEVFPLPITSSAATPSVTITNGVNEAYSSTLDAAGDLFVANYGANTVTEYPAPLTSGEAASVTISSGMDSPCGGLAFDGNGYLYVINYSGGVINEYVPPFTNASAPAGASAGMGDPCYGGLSSSHGSTFTLSFP